MRMNLIDKLNDVVDDLEGINEGFSNIENYLSEANKIIMVLQDAMENKKELNQEEREELFNSLCSYMEDIEEEVNDLKFIID